MAKRHGVFGRKRIASTYRLTPQPASLKARRDSRSWPVAREIFRKAANGSSRPRRRRTSRPIRTHYGTYGMSRQRSCASIRSQVSSGVRPATSIEKSGGGGGKGHSLLRYTNGGT